MLNNSFYVTPLDCFTHRPHRLACSAGSDRVSTCQAGAGDSHLGGQAAGVSFGHDSPCSPPSVVDAKQRVNGVRNLRIADSSIMPRIASVATMAPCVLIGERMAEILSKKA